MVDLCKILKGHGRETFYSPIYGDVYIHSIEKDFIQFGPVNNRTIHLSLAPNGSHINYPNSGECLIFPSKNQRDWNRWIVQQELKNKTWDTLKVTNAIVLEAVDSLSLYCTDEPIIMKSAIALLKIHEIIEWGYGGNITTKEWEDENTNIYYILKADTSFFNGNPVYWINNSCSAYYEHFAFHTKEQAKEFLSYPENIQLLNDFYMI